MHGEQCVMHAARVRNVPCYIPRMFLDGLQRAPLIGTYRVLMPHISRLIDRPVQFVEKTPAVAGSLTLVVGVGLAAVGSDALQNLGRLVGAGQRVIKDVSPG